MDASSGVDGSRMLGASGTRFALATPHVLATDTGRRAFERGGNSIDAAVAAAAMLAVVYPNQCSPGGDLFAVVSAPGGRLTAVNGSGAAPRAVDVAALRARGNVIPERGPLTITVPGVVAGWESLTGLGGRLELSTLLAEAVAAAADGVPVVPGLARAVASLAPTLALDPGMAEVMLPDGRPLSLGSTLRQPALAATLQAVAEGGAEALYGGDPGRRLVEGLRALGSPIVREDLTAHRTEIREPLRARYRRREIVTSPPNSQGFALLQILRALERIEPSPDPLGGSVHSMVEMFRLAARDRDRFLCDPRRTEVPLDVLLGEEHLDDLARRASDAGPGAHGPERPRRPTGDTVAVVAMDAEGYAVSLIQSVFASFGSGLLEPSTGLILHNRGTAFSLDPRHPGLLEGGVRPPHTLSPVLVLGDDGRTEAAVGTMGAWAQPQILAQALIRLIDHGADPLEAVSAPRWVLPRDDLPDGGTGILAEPAAADAVRPRLATAGASVRLVEADSEDTGHAQVVMAREGRLTAGSDPRADGGAAAG